MAQARTDTDKPLTGSQRRAAEQLLDIEANRLWTEFHTRYDQTDPYRQGENQARQEWEDANPAYMEVKRKAEKYLKRVTKRLEQFAAEAEPLVPRKVQAGYVGSALHLVGGDNPWNERSRELTREWQTTRNEHSTKVQETIAQARINILRATLGVDLDSLITLPSLDEILAE